MRSLLDVHVVLALLDSNHVHRQRAHAWWAAHAKQGWASCPIRTWDWRKRTKINDIDPFSESVASFNFSSCVCLPPGFPVWSSPVCEAEHCHPGHGRCVDA
jgi:hypothetical protein